MSQFRLLGSALGGAIFLCTDSTYEKCVTKGLLGLPKQHIAWVQDVRPGMMLFLFNTSSRRLYGNFQAVSAGGLNLNPDAWPSGSGSSRFPAQVRHCAGCTASTLRPNHQLHILKLSLRHSFCCTGFRLWSASHLQLLCLTTPHSMEPTMFLYLTSECEIVFWATSVSKDEGHASPSVRANCKALQMNIVRQDGHRAGCIGHWLHSLLHA